MRAKKPALGLVFAILAALGMFLIQIIVQNVISFPYLLRIIADGGYDLYGEELSERLLNGTNFLNVYMFVYGIAGSVAGYFVWKALRKDEIPLKDAAKNGRSILMGLGLGLAVQGLTALIFMIVFSFLPERISAEYEMMMDRLTYADASGFDAFLGVLGTGILVPIVEELFLRGIALNAAGRHMSKQAAVVVTAVIFALIHIGNMSNGVSLAGVLPQVITTLFAGLVLGWAAVTFRTLLVPVMIHIGVNFSAEMLTVFGGDMNATVYNIIAGSVGIILTVLVVIVYKKGLVKPTEAKSYGELREMKLQAYRAQQEE
ncbi:MAG: CPBP family intramembrane metalloprotease [Lachnospiraceae bacterium]|nr:CPBP family intramembrane metalloprotease [Lachnospiraceae bacterium]